MIINYRNNLDYNNDDFKVIFAPNGSGKTLYAESIMEMQWEEMCINRSSINAFLSVENAFNYHKNTSKNWDLKISKEPYIKKDQIEELNNLISSTGAKIKTLNNKIFLKDITICKGRVHAKFSLTSIEAIRKIIKVSSSEIESIMIYIFTMAYSNVRSRIILDDPIEYASFEFEDRFVNFIAKSINIKITILTHRMTLFCRLIGLIKQKESNKIICNFFYFLDDKPYLIQNKSSNFLNELIDKKLPKNNTMFKRDLLEKTIGNIKSFGSYDEMKTLKSMEEEKLSISLDKSFDINYDKTLLNGDLCTAISAKRDCMNHLRQEILNEISRKMNKSVKTLGKAKLEDHLKSKGCLEEMDIIKRVLNAANHNSNWIMFNEIKLKYILNLILKNLKLNKISTLCKKILSIIDDNNIQEDSEPFEDFVIEYFKTKTNGNFCVNFTHGRERCLSFVDNEFIESNDGGGGVVGWEEGLSYFLNSIEKQQ